VLADGNTLLDIAGETSKCPRLVLKYKVEVETAL
jgi:hypothetical protein